MFAVFLDVKKAIRPGTCQSLLVWMAYLYPTSDVCRIGPEASAKILAKQLNSRLYTSIVTPH